MILTPKRRKIHIKRRNKAILIVIIASILIIVILSSYSSISYKAGWIFTDKSVEGGCVTQGDYYGKQDSLKFIDENRFGFCFADIEFHSSYQKGNFSFDLLVIDKSQLNTTIYFWGDNGLFSKVYNLEELGEENVWDRIDLNYDCDTENINVYRNGICVLEGNFTEMDSNNFNRMHIKTNDDGIAEFYIDIISLN